MREPIGARAKVSHTGDGAFVDDAVIEPIVELQVAAKSGKRTCEAAPELSGQARTQARLNAAASKSGK